MWSEWMLRERQKEDFTPKGHPKRPSYVEVAEFCLKAWTELDRSLIQNSFIYCNLGAVSDTDKLHHRLSNLLMDGDIPEEDEEHSGLTDEEDTYGEDQTGHKD